MDNKSNVTFNEPFWNGNSEPVYMVPLCRERIEGGILLKY